MRACSVPVAIGALALGIAGCGPSTPHLARTDAAPLAALADRIAHEAPCAQRRDLATMRAKAIALVNRKAVPAGLEEPLLSGVNDLASRAPACAPPPPSQPAPAASPAPAPPGHEHGPGHPKKNHGHGRGHGNDHGDGGD
jgi:hypothetical protein